MLRFFANTRFGLSLDLKLLNELFKAYKEYVYIQAEIAKQLDLRYTAVSEIIKLTREKERRKEEGAKLKA